MRVFIIVRIRMARTRWSPYSEWSFGYSVLLTLLQKFFAFYHSSELFVYCNTDLGVAFSVRFFFLVLFVSLFAEFEASLYAEPAS